MLETLEVTIRKIVSLDLITTVWCKMTRTLEEITVVSTLIRAKDSTAKASNIPTSSLIVASQTIPISRMRRNSPEEIRNTKTVLREVTWSIHLWKKGSRETLRSTLNSWTNQQRVLRISHRTTKVNQRIKMKPKLTRTEHRARKEKANHKFRKKKTW